MLPGSGGLSIFSTEYLTSPASSSLPLWNLTPLRRLKVIDFWSAAIRHDSARAGLRFRFRSHSTSESYAACLPQWFEVRIAPNGATWTGSCSSAKVIRPPRRGAWATLRFGAAFDSAGDRAGGHRTGGDDPCLDERVATGQPSVARALDGFLVGHSVVPPFLGAGHRICPTRGASPAMSS